METNSLKYATLSDDDFLNYDIQEKVITQEKEADFHFIENEDTQENESEIKEGNSLSYLTPQEKPKLKQVKGKDYTKEQYETTDIMLSLLELGAAYIGSITTGLPADTFKPDPEKRKKVIEAFAPDMPTTRKFKTLNKIQTVTECYGEVATNGICAYKEKKAKQLPQADMKPQEEISEEDI